MSKRFLSTAFFLVMVLFSSGAWAGMVSLTFDDGLASVYNYAFPILKKNGQVATVGVISSKLRGSDENYMRVAQLKELQAAGWEIASHSLTNTRPSSIPWYYDKEPVTDWTKDQGAANTFHAEYEYDHIAGIYENGQLLTEVETLAEVEKQPGTWHLDRPLAALHVHPLTMTDPEKLQIRAGSYEREMDQSKQELSQQGFTVTSFMAPGAFWTDEIKKMSEKYYPYAVAGNGADNRRGSFDPHAIKRFLVHQNDSAATLIRLIQENAQARHGWVILRMHGISDMVGSDHIPAGTLEQLSDWLVQHNMKVVTIPQGAAILSGDKAVESPVKKP